jgi:hypothetical protein
MDALEVVYRTFEREKRKIGNENGDGAGATDADGKCI